MKYFYQMILFIVFSFFLISCESPLSAQEVIDRLDITFAEGDSYTSVTANVGLPSSSIDNDEVVLTWTSSHPEIIDTIGRVTRQNEDTTVTLTVTLTLKDQTLTKDFYVTVKGLYQSLKVRFRVMGATYELLNVPYGDTIDALEDPYVEGFAFMGWFISPELTEEFSFDDPVTEDLVIEAKFEALTEGTITVNYYFENIQNEDYTKDNSKTTIDTYDVGTLVVVNDTFVGFQLNQALSTTTTSVSAGVNKVMNVYYTRNRYTIEFMNEGVSQGQFVIKHGATIDEPEDLVREGYTFEGWSVTEVGRTPYVFGQAVTQPMTFYAIWTSEDAYTYDGYYTGADGLTGYSLTVFLRNLVNTGFTRVDYGASRYILDETDRDPNNSSRVILVYLGTSVSGAWDGGVTWNREHVWPQSLLGVSVDNNSVNQGSDLHNLKPSNPAENSSRGNKFFDWSTDADSYLPRAEVRGDVARILFYMATSYDFLSLVNRTPATYQMAMLNVLLQWHEDDPVDDFEMNRNDVIYSYQHNRNPFIDHPEFVEKIWGTSTLSNTQEHQPFYLGFDVIPFVSYTIYTPVTEKKEWI